MSRTQEIVIYQSENGDVSLSADFHNDTIWATQAQIEKIFDIDQSGVSRHIRNIFKSGEVDEKSNMQKMHIALSDKPVTFYSLDVILSVGYRANSGKAIGFRKWANTILRDYLLNGVAVNDNRLKQLSKARFSDAKKTNRLSRRLERFIKHLTGRNYIRVFRKKPLTCCT